MFLFHRGPDLDVGDMFEMVFRDVEEMCFSLLSLNMLMLEMAAIKAKNDSMIMRIMLRAIHRRHKSSLQRKN